MRILAISDLHGHLPRTEEWPKADVLIIAGDICPDYRAGRLDTAIIPKYGIVAAADKQMKWMEEAFFPWAANIDIPRIYYTWGNHDWINGEYAKEGSAFGPRCVIDREIRVIGQNEEDVRIWFSPWSNRFMDWNWMLHSKEMAAKMAEIPEGIDVIVSHAPPFGLADQAGAVWNNDHLGSTELLNAIDRVVPKVVICGHIHGGHGYAAYKHKPIILNPEAPLMEQQALVKLTQVYNVAHVDEGYDPVHGPTLITV